MTDPQAPHRRSETRHAVHLEVDCAGGGGDTFLYAYITDISSMGIFIKTDTPLPVGTMLELGFMPPATGPAEDPPPRRLELTGEVMWNTSGGANTAPGMGVRFHHTSPKTRQRLLELVRAIAYLDSTTHPSE